MKMVKLIEVPRDEYWISKLEDCWEEIVLSDDFNKVFFCKLSSRTYELFRHYLNIDKIPKELIRLISIMGAFIYNKKGVPFSDADIASEVAKTLLCLLECDNEIQEILNEEESALILCYEEKKYLISTNTFDFSQIVNEEVNK